MRTDTGPAGLVHPSSVDRDSRGNYYVVSRRVPTRIAVFDSAGRFLRDLGTEGATDGAFEFAWALRVGPGDSVFVVDVEKRHIQVISPDWRPVRAFRFPTLIEQFTWLGPDSLLVNASLFLEQRNRLPLHIYSTTGSRGRSITEEMPERSCTVDAYWTRPFALGPSATLWAARRARYRLEQWDLRTGTLLNRIDRAVPWFPPADTLFAGVTPAVPPQPRIVAIQVDELGRVWVASLIADARWADAVSGPMQDRRGTYYTVSDLERYFDSIIEVIEPSTGRVVAQRRLDAYLVGAVGRDYVAFRKRPGQRGFVDIITVNLRSPR